MKQISLASLTLQNALSILLLRYVRTTSGPRFINSTAVINSEIQKTDSSGKSRTIQVEVRKKRTLIKSPEVKKNEPEIENILMITLYTLIVEYFAIEDTTALLDFHLPLKQLMHQKWTFRVQ